MSICDECIHLKHHLPGSVHAVAEGHDDPYDYWYCRKGWWDSDIEFTEGEWPGSDDCKDYCPPRED